MGRLLSTAELTAVLGISRKSVYGLVRQGKLCPVEGIDMVVTGRSADPAIVGALRDRDCEVLVAD